MRRYAFLAAWLGMLAGCPPPMHPATPVKPKLHTEPTTDRSYWLYVPSYYSADRQWPLVITLHGTYGWDGARAQAIEWKYIAEQHGLIVAAPRLKSVQGILPKINSLWYKDLDADEQFVLAVLEDLCGKYTIDRRAVLLTGFSAGGYPLYHIGLKNPNRFTAMIARACNSSYKILERIKLTDEARKMPIVIYWGKDDLGKIHKDSWLAFRWLREHGCKGAVSKQVRGGHFRRPELAYRFWRPHLPKEHQADPGGP